MTVKPELTDQQIEAIIADAIAAEASTARREAQPPSSAIVWWRAQMRARQEAARSVERPLTIVHGLAIACGVGLLLSIVGTAVAGVKGSFGWLTALYGSITAPAAATGAAGGWTSLPLVATMTMLAMAVLAASVVAYVIFADE
jgi:hypothetical protein